MRRSPGVHNLVGTMSISRAWVADALMAAALAVVSVAFSIPDVVASLLALALSASLAVRRSAPVVALVVATAAAVAQAMMLTNLSLSIVAVPVLVYSFARWSGRALAWSALGVGLAGAVAGPVGWLTARPDAPTVSGVVTTVAAYAGVVVVAHIVGQRGRERAEAQARRERELVERQRLELAREVHDVVAHSLSMIAVQAEGGRALVTRSPERGPEILSVIADESRNALNEIRDMVSLMRRPALSLGDVRQLVDRLGDRARLRIAGQDLPISPMLSLSVYRVVQESLTNFLRHAGPSAEVDVAVVITGDNVDVTVRDNGCGSAAASDGKGHGLETMRERVLAHGGTMTAGAVASGYEVRAVFPIGARA
jgi:signal transduction histidine kinase